MSNHVDAQNHMKRYDFSFVSEVKMNVLVSRVTTPHDFTGVDQHFEGISITSNFYPEFGDSVLLPHRCITPVLKVFSINDYLDSHLWSEL